MAAFACAMRCGGRIVPWAMLRAATDRSAVAWLAAAMGCVGLAGLASGLGPLALKAFVDVAATPAGMARHFVGPLCAYAGAILAQRGCEQLQAFAYARGELLVSRRFGTLAFEHLLRLPLAAHLDLRSGALTQSLADGLLGLRILLSHTVTTALPVIVQLAVAGAVLNAELGGALGLLLVAAVLAYGAVFALGVGRLAAPLRGISTGNLDAGAAVSDSLMNIEALKAFTAEDEYAARYGATLRATEGHWKRFLLRRLESGGAAALVFAATLMTSLWLVASDVAEGRLSVGVIVMLNAYVLQIVRPVELLGFAVRDMGQGLAYLATLSGLLARSPEPSGHLDTPRRAAEPADLVFEDVDFDFGRGRDTLREISFRAAPSSTLAIVGPSGSGKSTLIRLLLGFYAPSRGQIRMDGRPIGEMGLTALRRQIALVAQDTILLNDTLAANIALGASDPPPAAIAAAAASARLAPLIAGLPDGLATRVGERGLKLSGGEKQRVAIARAALKGAGLIVFDEATAALDPGTERAVWRALDGVGAGATRIIVTHRLAAIRHADEILVLDSGRIVERGRHEQLMGSAGPYRRLWDAQGHGAETASA